VEDWIHGKAFRHFGLQLCSQFNITTLKINDLLGESSHLSQTHLVYQHSENGAKRPLLAAEYALGISLDSPTGSAGSATGFGKGGGGMKMSKSASSLRKHESDASSLASGGNGEKGVKAVKKKLSVINSAIFSRVLSKHDQ